LYCTLLKAGFFCKVAFILYEENIARGLSEGAVEPLNLSEGQAKLSFRFSKLILPELNLEALSTITTASG